MLCIALRYPRWKTYMKAGRKMRSISRGSHRSLYVRKNAAIAMSHCAYAHRPIVIDRTCIEVERHYERDTSSHRRACFLSNQRCTLQQSLGRRSSDQRLSTPSGVDHVLSSYAAQRYPTSSRVALGSRSCCAFELLAISSRVLDGCALDAAQRHPTSSRVALGSRSCCALELLAISNRVLESCALASSVQECRSSQATHRRATQRHDMLATASCCYRVWCEIA